MGNIYTYIKMINEPNLQPKIQHFFELSIPEELIWKHYGEGVLLNLFVKLCWDFLLRFFLRFFWDSFWDFFFNFNFFELFIPEEVIWKHYGRGVLLNNSLANWRRPLLISTPYFTQNSTSYYYYGGIRPKFGWKQKIV